MKGEPRQATGRTDAHTLSAKNYGKGSSLVLRRSEIPVHEENDHLELTVARPSSPEQQFTLYARDNQTSRDAHFVATQLNPEKGERFLVESLRKYGLGEFAEGYNQNKPAGLENSSLVSHGNGISMNADGMEANLTQARLSGYGRRIMLQAEFPRDFQTGNPKLNEIRILKAGDRFEIGLADGSRPTSESGLKNGHSVTSVRREGQTLMFDYEKTRATIPSSLEGVRGRRGGEINLGKIEDRAWLGALVVGEGSFFAAKLEGGKRLIPCLAIAMNDEQAIERAAALMGVRKTASNPSHATGRTAWRATAVGGRAIEIFEQLRPFLTETKTKQAEAAIRSAREAGFLTKSEMKERQKNRLLEEVVATPGAGSRELRNRRGINAVYAMKYLRELRDEGKIEERKSDTPKHGVSYWYPKNPRAKNA